MRYVILGTAGHIDHGKSSLVKALTGVDPDRLKEEKERGITIDLGFADLEYPDGLTVGIVDVPGHERLIKNMLAGAGGIDLVLFVIAADESIMPQSREHLHICNLLRIKTGLIAITKADLVEAEWLALVTDDVKAFVKGTFLEDADIVPVSSKTMFNVEFLKEKIREVALKVEPKQTKGHFQAPHRPCVYVKGFRDGCHRDCRIRKHLGRQGHRDTPEQYQEQSPRTPQPRQTHPDGICRAARGNKSSGH